MGRAASQVAGLSPPRVYFGFRRLRLRRGNACLEAHEVLIIFVDASYEATDAFARLKCLLTCRGGSGLVRLQVLERGGPCSRLLERVLGCSKGVLPLEDLAICLQLLVPQLRKILWPFGQIIFDELAVLRMAKA